MKKLIFGLVATVVFGMSANAQVNIKDLISAPTTIPVEIEIYSDFKSSKSINEKSTSKNDFFVVTISYPTSSKEKLDLYIVVNKQDNRISGLFTNSERVKTTLQSENKKGGGMAACYNSCKVGANDWACFAACLYDVLTASIQ